MTPRGDNAQLAVEMFRQLNQRYSWTAADAWMGIALLLLTCNVWGRKSWEPFHNVVVYRESNDFEEGPKGPNAVLRRAEDLTQYLAKSLGIERAALCDAIGLYWKHDAVSTMQPHNLVGHAFRSLTVAILEKYGSEDIRYEEEVNPYDLFKGTTFKTRSKKPAIDIVAYKDNSVAALISCRWRFRHDRVDVVDEALSYSAAIGRLEPRPLILAMLGEFAPARLDKVLKNCIDKEKHAPIDAVIHFKPELITEALGENGRLTYLKSLEWLINETHSW